MRRKLDRLRLFELKVNLRASASTSLSVVKIKMKYFLFFIEIIYAQSCPASGEMIWKTGKRITQELSSPARY